jgi:hypothetical protein
MNNCNHWNGLTVQFMIPGVLFTAASRPICRFSEADNDAIDSVAIFKFDGILGIISSILLYQRRSLDLDSLFSENRRFQLALFVRPVLSYAIL